MQRSWEQAAADLKRADAAARHDVPELAAAEADFAAARHRAARAAERVSSVAAPRLGPGPEPPLGSGPKNDFANLVETASEIRRAEQMQDPALAKRWRAIWDRSDGWRAKMRAEWSRAPARQRPTTTQPADDNTLWDLYRQAEIHSVAAADRAYRFEESKLIDRGPALVDAGRDEGTANADADLAEAYVGAITPPVLAAARDRERRALTVLMNARTTTRPSHP